MTDQCNPCQVVACIPPEDLSYNLQRVTPTPLPPVPPPPTMFGNAEVEYCCGEEETMEYDGTLPSWLTIDEETNCLIGAANTYQATTQAAANNLAQNALDSFVESALESGDLTCSSGGECIPPDFERESIAGEITTGSPISTIFAGCYSEQVTFNGVAGQSVAIWVKTNNLYYPQIALISPSLVVLDQDTFDRGYQGNTNRSAGITYTLPATGVYTIEVAGESVGTVGAFTAIISDGIEDTIALDPFPWVMIYVPSTNRFFVLHGFSGSTATVTVLNSLDGSIVGTVTLVTGIGGGFSPARPTLFYNPNDDSVWAAAMDVSLSFSNFHRLNPSTGAELEVIPLSVSTYKGAFVPSLNRVYDNRTLGFNISSIGVFDCTTRTYGANISLSGTFSITGQRYLPEIDRVLIVTSDRYWLINPNDNSITSAFLVRITMEGFEKDSLYYTAKGNSPRTLRAVDLLTGVVSLELAFAPNAIYNVTGYGYNECRECAMIGVSNGGSDDWIIASVRVSDFVATESVWVPEDTSSISHAAFIWNPDTDRMWCMYQTGSIYILS